MSTHYLYDDDNYESAWSVWYDYGSSYDWHVVSLYQHKPTGNLFVGSDSGCSCNSPFEAFEVDQLEPITRLQDLYNYFSDSAGKSPADIDSEQGLIRKARELAGWGK